MKKVRQVIEIPGATHKNPIPSGVRIGPLVVSGGISGAKNNEIPKDDAEQQAKNMFENIATFMELAGGSTAHIAQIKIYVKDDKYKTEINKYWLEMFPHEDDRPARHTLLADLRGNMLMQAEVVAYIE